MTLAPFSHSGLSACAALLCAGCWLLPAPVRAADQALTPVMTKYDSARKTLEEEEMETTLADQRVSAKFRVAYGDHKDSLIKPRPSQVHDRVTFVIKDDTSTSIEANTKLDTSFSANFNLQNWFKLDRNENGDVVLQPYSMSTSDGSISTTTQTDAYSQFKADSSSVHDGKTKTNRKNTFTTKLSGEVIEVLPNGHLVVEATKSIQVNNETQTVKLLGRVDPNDLNDSAEIDGDRILGLQISFTGKGELTDAVQAGWLTRIVNKFKLF